MLKKLKIENLAIIEDIELDFKDNLTTLIGETGAGKSLIIDSINLLLGSRAQGELIRTGFQKASILGIFTSNNLYLKAYLKSLEIDIEDDIEIKRIISLDSLNKIYVNNKSVSLQELKKIGSYLADIHIQDDTRRLINPENYISIIDGFKLEKRDVYLNKYREALSIYKNSVKEYKNLLKEKEDLFRRKDIYEYELNEISSYDLKENEDEILKEEISTLNNFDKVYGLIQNILNREEEINALDSFYDSLKDLETLSTYSHEFEELNNKFKDNLYELDDVYQEIKKKFKSLDFDPIELDKMNSRLNSIEKLKDKYHKSISELLDYKLELEDKINKTDNYDELLKDSYNSVLSSFEILKKEAISLSSFRKEIANSIEKELMKVLADLMLEKTRFKIDFKNVLFDDPLKESIFMEDGIDEIDFLISTNVGEELKPLSKTVSGGEMSRIMLGLKTILLRSQNISTIIFDEIDTGISGKVASKVATKIKEISLNMQVIAITHLPQVASKSDHQFLIEKEIKKDRTFTKVKELSFDEFVYEIAKMLAQEEVSDVQIEAAKAMILT